MGTSEEMQEFQEVRKREPHQAEESAVQENSEVQNGTGVNLQESKSTPCFENLEEAIIKRKARRRTSLIVLLTGVLLCLLGVLVFKFIPTGRNPMIFANWQDDGVCVITGHEVGNSGYNGIDSIIIRVDVFVDKKEKEDSNVLFTCSINKKFNTKKSDDKSVKYRLGESLRCTYGKSIFSNEYTCDDHSPFLFTRGGILVLVGVKVILVGFGMFYYHQRRVVKKQFALIKEFAM
eukprot:TRINITY_DN3387_c1_g1_i1.p2 TRINITY_DN3387_c1_g1~~TRINITY_DN3387_c1_g1_i1.p2  ORF type:complete len:234 (-),score=27.19 TRINITY_DN3387_c1_g1_i1:7-708(-)